MGVLDSIFGSGSATAVPGGNLTKPIIIALLGLLASRALSGSRGTAAPGAPSNPIPANPGGVPGAQPTPAQDLSPGGVLGGLGGLLESFTRGGQGDIISSWIGTGVNKAITPAQLGDALGAETLDQLSRQTAQKKISKIFLLKCHQGSPCAEVPLYRCYLRLRCSKRFATC